MELIGNSPHGDGVHPVGTKFTPLVTEFTMWGWNSFCGDGINPMGTEFILWGWNSSCWDGIYPIGMEFTPLGTEFTRWGNRGRPHSHSPSLESGSAQSARKLEPLWVLFPFLFFGGFFVCLFRGWVFCLFGWFFVYLFLLLLLVFWEEIPAFPAGAGSGRWGGCGGGYSQSMTTMQSFPRPSFQLHLEFHPQLKDFPLKPGGCPQHDHSPKFPNVPFLQSHSQCPPRPLPLVLALWYGSHG